MIRVHALWIAGLLGAAAVGAGAFGAHGLKDALGERSLELWKTAAHYQLLHAVALAAVSAPARPWPLARQVAAAAWVLGALVFSGTLYAMALGAPRWLGAITPLGGLALIGGWLAIAAWGLGLRHPGREDLRPD